VATGSRLGDDGRLYYDVEVRSLSLSRSHCRALSCLFLAQGVCDMCDCIRNPSAHS
jgi:hypothetical protein